MGAQSAGGSLVECGERRAGTYATSCRYSAWPQAAGDPGLQRVPRLQAWKGRRVARKGTRASIGTGGLALLQRHPSLTGVLRRSSRYTECCHLAARLQYLRLELCVGILPHVQECSIVRCGKGVLFLPCQDPRTFEMRR